MFVSYIARPPIQHSNADQAVAPQTKPALFNHEAYEVHEDFGYTSLLSAFVVFVAFVAFVMKNM
jgi:hypothetical protein